MSNNSSVLERSAKFDEMNVNEIDKAATLSEEAVSKDSSDMIRVLASFHRRLLDTYHHRLERLWVSVNGIPVASLDVFNEDNSLTVTTRVAEPLSFVEVFSEQQIRLAMLNANTGPDNPD
jgi:hypothetical protein